MTNHFVGQLIWRMIMAQTMNRLYTAGEYPLDEVASALQKCIRRGLLQQALFWAQELESKYPTFLWKRLEMIAHEDIGVANPMAIMFVATCREQFWHFRETHKKAFSLPVINAVTLLCQSPKTRMADHLYSLIYLSPLRFDIPDFALDKHTKRGRDMGRDIDHFYQEGAQIEPDAGLNEYLEQAWDIDRAKQERRWLTELKAKLQAEKFGGRSRGKVGGQMSMLEE